MLAARIAKLRKSYGMSQLELAKSLYISASAEGMYEQGRRTPSLEILIEMSLLFHVSLDYLITGTEHAPTCGSCEKVIAMPPQCCGFCCGIYCNRICDKNKRII